MSRLLIATLSLSLAFASGCRKQTVGADTIRVGATPVPHAQILEHVKPALASQGITLQIVELTDYVQPNLALAEGELEANFFQHAPYLAQFNADRGTKLVAVAKVHVEPLGIYSRRHAELKALPQKATVAIPNDPTNAARALMLLQHAGLITLRGDGLRATVQDVKDNPRGLVIRELESAQLPRSLPDVDAAVINTNYALEAGLDPTREALAIEGSESPYANVLVTRPELVEDRRVKALIEALQSQDTRDFITRRFGGAIVPVK